MHQANQGLFPYCPCIVFVDAQTMMIFFLPSKKTPDKGAFDLQSPMHQRVFVPENCI
jgi:hypothetical protein